MRIAALLLALIAGPATAETVVALRTLPARTILSQDDLDLVATETAGALSEIGAALGMELRTAVYAGHAILATNLQAPALVERNQIVALIYASGGLIIRAEGRALARAGAGEDLRVMNTASRTTLTGRVAPDGSVWIIATR